MQETLNGHREGDLMNDGADYECASSSHSIVAPLMVNYIDPFYSGANNLNCPFIEVGRLEGLQAVL